jgi:hypothetical protein
MHQSSPNYITFGTKLLIAILAPSKLVITHISSIRIEMKILGDTKVQKT